MEILRFYTVTIEAGSVKTCTNRIYQVARRSFTENAFTSRPAVGGPRTRRARLKVLHAWIHPQPALRPVVRQHNAVAGRAQP
ncbi:hypothetical protein EVAR_64432_1 [Eumeta japonica]|uniref:Uncharacterized protein n=1 Tax=Eumeta variegata TaxID=151549 RepID=A0A4C1ZMM1_EUMVA|nr:hypothetical protein EVAR_64432_1 [Eumeta japonica]